MAPCRRQRAFHGIARLAFERKLRGLLRVRIRERVSVSFYVCRRPSALLGDWSAPRSIHVWAIKTDKTTLSCVAFVCVSNTVNHLRTRPTSARERTDSAHFRKSCCPTCTHGRLRPQPWFMRRGCHGNRPMALQLFPRFGEKRALEKSEKYEKSEKKQVVGSHSRTHLPPVHAPD